MSLEIVCDAHGCRNRNFDEIYCPDCYIALQKELDEAYLKIAQLEDELASR